MAKNNMDILLGNILGSAAISPDNKTVEQTPETKPIPKQEKRSVKGQNVKSNWTIPGGISPLSAPGNL